MNTFFAELLDRLRLTLGLTDLRMDDSRQCSLEMDGFLLMVRYFPASNEILLSTSVARLPAETGNAQRLVLYRRLLQGQYFFQHSAGATLSLDSDESLVALQQVENIRVLDHDGFLRMVEHFMQVADYWREQCQHCLQAPASALADSPAPGQSDGVSRNPFDLGLRV